MKWFVLVDFSKSIILNDLFADGEANYFKKITYNSSH